MTGDMGMPSNTGVTLVLGPPNSGKRGLVLEWWQERLPLGPVVVMPTGPDAEDMSAEMARRTGGLVGQSSAVTFAGLVRLVLGRPCRYAYEFERTLLVSQLLRGTELETLDRAGHLPGVVSALAVLLLQLGESGRSPEEVDNILARWALSEPGAASTATDVRRLAAGYSRACTLLGLLDHAAAVREAVRFAEGWHRPVAFWGFSSFTRGQRELMEALSNRVQLLLTLSHERGCGLGLCAPEEVEWWLRRASEIVEVSPRTRAYASPEIEYLERSFVSEGLRSQPPPARGGADGVRFLLASGRRAEAELAAEHIAELIRTGSSPGSIAVVVRRVRNWSDLLGDVLASCGIPCQIDDHRHLGGSGLGFAFLEAFKGVALDDAESILSYLRSPYSAVAVEEVSDLELRYRRGATRGMGALADLAEREVRDALKPVWALIPTSAPEPLCAGTRLDLTAARALAERMLTAGARGVVAGSREIREDSRAFRALQAAFATIADVGAAGDFGWCLEPQVALRLLAQVGVSGPHRPDPEVVQILSAQRARARRFDAVFVLGLVEGEFPALPDRPSLLSAEHRRNLDLVGGGLFPPYTERENALFVGAASRAWRLLYLSARDAEDDGSEAVPSRFWHAARALLGTDQDDHKARSLADQVFTPESAPSLRHYLRACAAAGCAPHSGGREGEAPVQVRSWRRPPARLDAPDILTELAAVEDFSPSGLESYANCPFMWFIERVVGTEDVGLELEDRMIGDLIHRVLGECYESLDADGLLPLRRENLAEAGRRASTFIDGLAQGPDCPGTFAERRMAAWRLKSMARRLFDREVSGGGQLVFKEAEAWIGDRRGVDIGGLRIRGRIDRIDTTPDGQGLFVLDYKSGAIPSVSAIGTDAGLQLPLYLMALAAERADVEIVGGAYLSLSAGELTGVVTAGREELLGARMGRWRVLDQTQWEELSISSREVAQAAAAGMRAGLIAPQSDRPCPSWCRLGPVCRSRRGGYRR
jgi:RecB family exonuclease